MGSNHARVIAGLVGARLDVVVDLDLDRARSLADRFGGAPATHVEALLNCDAVIVACATSAHADVALPLIDRGMPLLIEKPVADTAGETAKVVEASQQRGTLLMCGFVERFNAVVMALRDILSEPPLHILSVRHSPANPRSVSSVAYDLLIHDIDLALSILQQEALHVRGAMWSASRVDTVADIADCIITFPDGAIATLSASRAGQRKIRTMQVDTGSWLYELDLLRQNITIYRNVNQAIVGNLESYRAETIVDIPFVRHTAEPLVAEVTRFLWLLEQDGVAIKAERDSILPPHAVVDQLSRDVSLRGQQTWP